MIQGYDQGLTQVVLGVGDSFIQAGRRRRSIRSVLKEDGQSTARSAPKEAVSLKVLGRKSRISPSKAHPPRNGAVPTIHHPQCALSRRRVLFSAHVVAAFSAWPTSWPGWHQSSAPGAAGGSTRATPWPPRKLSMLAIHARIMPEKNHERDVQ